jgi:hypothetical protein
MNASLKVWANLVKRCPPIRIVRPTFKWLIICITITFESAQIATAQIVRDEASVIDDSHAPFVYEAKAEIPSPPEDLAGFVSSTYRSSADEFQQHELLQKIKPVIERRIAEARATKLFVVKLGYTLPKYDFDRQGFLTPVNETSYINFNNSAYILRFTNWQEVDFIPFEESKARYLEPTLHGNRQATLRVYGTLKECREDSINGSDKKVIYLEATKAVLAVGAESRFAGQKLISSDPDAVGTPVPPTSTFKGEVPQTSASDTIQHLEDPRYKSLGDRPMQRRAANQDQGQDGAYPPEQPLQRAPNHPALSATGSALTPSNSGLTARSPQDAEGAQASLILRLSSALDAHDSATVLSFVPNGRTDYFGHRNASSTFIQKDMQSDARNYRWTKSIPDLSTFRTFTDANGIVHESIQMETAAQEISGKSHHAFVQMDISYQNEDPPSILSMNLRVLK